MKRFLAAVRFLTILPVPGRWGADPDDLAGSLPWFPVVGLGLGAVAAAAAWAIAPLMPPLLAAAAMVVLLMSFSGCLHLDGLADAADGLLSSRPRDEMLEIMKDSHVGVMGVVAIVVVVLVKFAALASLAARTPPEGAALWCAMFLMPLAGRCAMVVHVAVLPYARSDGLAAVFYRRRPRLAAGWAAAALAGAAWAVLQWRGVALWTACLAATFLLAVYVARKIGGATGDTLGAVCELVESVPALTLAVWPMQAGR
jgi:adenosylcobinamide-GDP ribazoletransferase